MRAVMWSVARASPSPQQVTDPLSITHCNEGRVGLHVHQESSELHNTQKNSKLRNVYIV